MADLVASYPGGTPVLAPGTMSNLHLDANGNLLVNVSQGNFSVSSGAVYNSSTPTFANGTTNALQADVNGNLKVDIASGTVNATSAATYNASAPTYSNGTSNPLQADSHGSLATAPRDGSGAAMGVLGNPIRVTLDATNTTAPVSLASLPALAAGSNLVGSVKISDGTNTASVASLTNAKALDVAIVDGSGNQITSFGGGTQYADGATQATPTGTIALAKNSSNVVHALAIDGSGNLNVNVAASATVPVSGTFWQATQPVSAASLPLPAGAATSAKQPALGTAGTAASDVLTVQGIASMTALKVDGSAVTQPVSIASVPTHAVTQSGAWTVTANAGTGTMATSAAQSGTWTVQPGNTANTTPWLMQSAPGTAGGWSVSSQTALSNTAATVKSSAGNFGGYMLYNPNASVVYVQVFDGTPTVGTTTPNYVIPVPATAGANLEISLGITHATSIKVAVTTTPTGSTAPATAVTGFFLYK